MLKEWLTSSIPVIASFQIKIDSKHIMNEKLSQEIVERGDIGGPLVLIKMALTWIMTTTSPLDRKC